MYDINRFYICEFCGNVIGMIRDAGVPVMCCGEEMTKLEPGTTDGSQEKHAPVVSVEIVIIQWYTKGKPKNRRQTYGIL